MHWTPRKGSLQARPLGAGKQAERPTRGGARHSFRSRETQSRQTLGEPVRCRRSSSTRSREAKACSGADGQLIVDTRPHTGRSPKDKFFVREPSSEATYRLERVEPSRSTRAIRRALGSRRRLSLRTRSLLARLLRRRRRALSRAAARLHRIGLAQPLRAPSLHHAGASRAGLRARVHGRRRRALPGRSRRATARRTRNVHSGELRATHHPHRRHALRGRDQEVRLHGYELPSAAARNAADALLGERRPSRRRRDSLRPLGHRQDDALLRFEPPADRRRRARLVGRRRLQLRRRLLREGHPPLAESGARDLGRDEPLFDRCSKTSSTTSARARSTSIPTPKPRTRARRIRSEFIPNIVPSSKARPPEDDHHADRRRVRRACRRSRSSRASRRCITSSPATPPK